MGISISWTLGPHFPDLIKGGAAGVVDNCIVHAGGCSWPWRERETGWFLDPEKGEWRPLPPMPEGRAYTSGVTTDNSLFVIGGRKSAGGRFGIVHRNCFRLSKQDGAWRWDVLPELCQGRAVPSLTSVGNVIYCVGGGSWITGFFAPDDVSTDEYLDLGNLDTGWREIPTCPGKRRAIAAATSAGGKVYIFGGSYGQLVGGKVEGVRLNDVWCFAPKAWEWREVSPLPVIGLSGAAAVTYNDRYIILVGGAVLQEPGGLHPCEVTYQVDEKRGVEVGWYNNRVFVYDVETDSYEELSEPLPYSTHDIRATILSDIIYAIGGENVDGTVSNTCAHVRVGKVRKI